MNEVVKKGNFPIVAIGASAGGLEALENFFRNMPVKNGMAFVVIQHLDPDHTGVMPELLQRVTSMKVLQADNDLKPRPDHVYVIPPNKSLTLTKEGFQLSDPAQPRGLRLPIDIFFRSLANFTFEKGIAIILSGMGSDGSLGIKAIKEKNGLVLIQDPADAKFDGMPRSAMQSVNPDLIDTADNLPIRLIEHLKISPASRVSPDENKSDLEKIIFLLKEKTRHDFSRYKKTTLYRRIERRQEVHKIRKIKDYVRFLMGNPVETEILFKELLIGVTNFFRDPDVWKKLREDILPGLIKRSSDGSIIRAWVAGCSTGEEAYSLAISFKEALEKSEALRTISLQIFATDIDHDAIEKARRGIFSPNIVMDVPHELIGSYFTSIGDGYRINNSIREMIVFAEQNVVMDPPFTKIDLLSCRNLLIYMEADLQKKLIALFHYALNPNGILLLGTSESLGNYKEKFIEQDARLKIFSLAKGLNTNILADTRDSFYRHAIVETGKKIPPPTTDNIQSLADQFILQNYAPSAVLINEKGDIIYFTGHTGKYLEPVAGKTNWNIFAMAHEGFRYELPGTIRKAIKSTEPVILRNIKIGTKNDVQYVDVFIEHIKDQGVLHDLILVTFIDLHPAHYEDKIRKTIKRKTDTLDNSGIEVELRKAYEDLQSTREEMQTSQEELKSTNEELQSTNEELQSTNEELTTSKEEMQSMNEELQTVNSELQSKISDLVQSNNDMKNLLNSTEIATLFLDRELNIRRFTDTVIKIFNIRSADIGRPYTDIVNNLYYTAMQDDARKVLSTLIPVVTEVRTTSDAWYSVRIMPYRTIDDRIDGLVITFTDITLSKRLEFKLKEAGERNV